MSQAINNQWIPGLSALITGLLDRHWICPFDHVGGLCKMGCGIICKRHVLTYGRVLMHVA